MTGDARAETNNRAGEALRRLSCPALVPDARVFATLQHTDAVPGRVAMTMDGVAV